MLKSNQPYQICSRCVMDTSAPDITFREDGTCNFCSDFLERHSRIMINNIGKLDAFITEIKQRGRGLPYDCVIGVSGGVDSSYALFLAVEAGLRPLAVHMDNGWDSELASNNIANLVRGLKVDLFTHVIDWEEYRDLMNSFFQANVIDVELLYDNAMLAVNFQQAKKNGIKYILSGDNNATEGIRMPKGWNWFKLDAKNIYAIQNKFGTKIISTMPVMSALEFEYFKKIRRIKWYSFLNYHHYNKSAALALLQERFNFKPYPYKHYESVFTRFYQGFILPRKFGVDKRRVHLSTLICTSQMSRESAIENLRKIPYPSQRDSDNDVQYFLKKMRWTREQLDAYLSQPAISHDVYPSEMGFYYKLQSIYASLKKAIWRHE